MTRCVLSLIGTLLMLMAASPAAPRVKVGADVLLEKQLDLVRGKRVGLITNQTGRTASGERLVDALIARGIMVTALFSPEHGIRGISGAGEKVGDSVDARTGLPVYSLYGDTRKPTAAMLRKVDLLLYDIQDIGVRFYTYLSTMTLCMTAAAEARIPFVVLDRPNPLGGMSIEGPVLPDSLRSDVGCLPIPVVYGLTIGELAAMANGEGWLEGRARAALTVVGMEGWTRTMRWDDTELPWIAPSPNIRTPDAARVYPATCYLEATNVSEGRGTNAPFQPIGAPFIRSGSLSSAISDAPFTGVEAVNATFIPASSKFKGELCRGAFLRITGPAPAVSLGLEILVILNDEYASSLSVDRGRLARLLGDASAYDLILDGRPVGPIVSRWKESLARFAFIWRRYWQYAEK